MVLAVLSKELLEGHTRSEAQRRSLVGVRRPMAYSSAVQVVAVRHWCCPGVGLYRSPAHARHTVSCKSVAYRRNIKKKMWSA